LSLTYTWRLLCLCCASFFVLHLALAVGTRLCAGTAVRMAARMKPSSAARLLFFLRIAPMALTVFALLAFCIPSYLWLEPEAAGEKVGLVCFLMAALGAAICALSVTRVVSAVRGTVQYLEQCERHGRNIHVPGEPSPALLLADDAPVLAVAGVVHPRLVISKRVLRGLTAAQRDAALRHERAHRTSRDNVKRFLILLSPDVLPFLRAFTALEQNWAKFTEWAADDQAVEGDSNRALSLASALVCVAKMGSKPKLSYLFSSLLADDHELTERVDRLLRPQPNPGKPAEVLLPFLTSAGALIGTAVVIVLLWPGSLSLVHQALERLVH
jgi:Zn-dependent protease with chaperone function